MTTITKDQAQMLATLACDSRPFGARRWRHDDVMAAIAKLADRNLPSVILAVTRCAMDRGAERPSCIGGAGSHWSDTVVSLPPEPQLRADERCDICHLSRLSHDIRFNADHPFITEAEAKKRAAGANPDRLAAIKATLEPTSGPTEPLTAEDFAAKNPKLHARIEAVRDALPGVRVDPALAHEPVTDPTETEEMAK